ncbi:MAG TPA: hypothetical protein VM263_07435 [Acidimicrobiales bacterium]|nr:hypothetical protein [Acidimicrobiales bacterium]
MLKRNVGVVLVAGLVLAGGAAALAGGSAPRPTLLAAAQADPTTPPSGPADGGADRRARAEALRACLQQAGEDRDARRACLAEAGPAVRHGLEHLRRGPFGAFPLGRAVHGTLTVPDGEGGWQEVTFDRGTVDEATDGSRIVLDRPDGPTVTVALTPDTEYHGIADAAAIVEGRPALVVSRDGTALHVAQRDGDRRRPGNKEGAPGVQKD